MIARWLAVSAAAVTLAACDSGVSSRTFEAPHEAGIEPPAPDLATLVTIQCPTKPPDPSRARVLVVDQGFDIRQPAFFGKIAGCYEVVCPDEEPDLLPRSDETDDQAAARIVQTLRTPRADCETRDRISMRIDANIEHADPAARERWNDAIFEKSDGNAAYQSYEFERTLDNLLGGDATDSFDSLAPPKPDPTYVYQGTWTAGAIAYANDVDIVLVNRPVPRRPEHCADPGAVNRRAALLGRSDVRDAFVHAPVSGFDKALIDLRRQHGAQVENHSRDRAAAIAAEFALPFDCGATFEDDNRVLGELDAERDAFRRSSGALDGADPLVFQSAGNDGLELASAADSVACSPNRVNRLLIGSYDVFRGQLSRSTFTNVGDCVDLYELGEAVVLPGPNGFYLPVSGTQVSAPLAARFASQIWKPSMSVSDLRDAVLAARDDYRFLPISNVPAELQYYSSRPMKAPSGCAPPTFREGCHRSECVEGTVCESVVDGGIGPNACGNGVKEDSEDCDGDDVGGATCETMTSGQRPGGSVRCTHDCKYDISGCVSVVMGSGDTTCGGNTCPGVPFPPGPVNAAWAACCPDGDQATTCGVNLGVLQDEGLPLATSCQPRSQPAVLDTSCPNSTFELRIPDSLTTPPETVTLLGCCRPDHTCGRSMDSVSFGFGLTLNTNVGCVPMASFDDAGAGRPCGLARSRDASTDAPAD